MAGSTPNLGEGFREILLGADLNPSVTPAACGMLGDVFRGVCW